MATALWPHHHFPHSINQSMYKTAYNIKEMSWANPMNNTVRFIDYSEDNESKIDFRECTKLRSGEVSHLSYTMADAISWQWWNLPCKSADLDALKRWRIDKNSIANRVMMTMHMITQANAVQWWKHIITQANAFTEHGEIFKAPGNLVTSLNGRSWHYTQA